MFIVGMVVGPALGLLGSDIIARAGTVGWWRTVAIILVLVFILIAPFFALELKLGLLFGTLLGLLLAGTPVDLETGNGVS